MSPTLRRRLTGFSAPDRSVATVAERLYPAFPTTGITTWITPLIITIFAGVIRFVHLGTPNAVVFDETYYTNIGTFGQIAYGSPRTLSLSAKYNF